MRIILICSLVYCCSLSVALAQTAQERQFTIKAGIIGGVHSGPGILAEVYFGEWLTEHWHLGTGFGINQYEDLNAVPFFLHTIFKPYSDKSLFIDLAGGYSHGLSRNESFDVISGGLMLNPAIGFRLLKRPVLNLEVSYKIQKATLDDENGRWFISLHEERTMKRLTVALGLPIRF